MHGDTSAGATAAPWIHLWALTLLLLVVLPRSALAWWNTVRAQWLARRVLLPLTDPYFQRLTQLQRGDVLFLYTDGLSEARDGLQEEYGEARLMASVLAHLNQPYDRLICNVVADVRRFAEGMLDDDLTVLAIAVQTGASASGRHAT